MAEVTIYTRPWCGYCSRAKAVLDRLDVPFDEIVLGGDPALERDMIRRSNGRLTVPQVFVRDRHVGGSEELALLAHRGGLEELARRAPAGEE